MSSRNKVALYAKVDLLFFLVRERRQQAVVNPENLVHQFVVLLFLERACRLDQLCIRNEFPALNQGIKRTVLLVDFLLGQHPPRLGETELLHPVPILHGRDGLHFVPTSSILVLWDLPAIQLGALLHIVGLGLLGQISHV